MAADGGYASIENLYAAKKRLVKDVVDADLSGYFDTIPHAELMRSVARRIVDRQLLALIKQWIAC